MPKRPRTNVIPAREEVGGSSYDSSPPAPRAGNYFTGPKPNLQFVSTGCTILDCALGGGWALGRVANVVGDRSTAKTALATEALINFMRAYPDGKAAYRDCEAAFDVSYADAMGLKTAEVDFGEEDKPLVTVEDFMRDFDAFLEARIKEGVPGIYVLDSLDSLSDEAEMGRELGQGTYGMAKPKLLSEMFRKSARKTEQANVLLLIVSQVRDNIGVSFGEKHKRSGGRALDFYASQILWLAHIGTLKRTINKVQRPYGVRIKAKVKKNKVGLPFREVEFDFLFAYGVDDLAASVEWLDEVGKLEAINAETARKYLSALESASSAEYNEANRHISAVVTIVWRDVETGFLPTRSKYGSDDEGSKTEPVGGQSS